MKYNYHYFYTVYNLDGEVILNAEIEASNLAEGDLQMHRHIEQQQKAGRIPGGAYYFEHEIPVKKIPIISK